MKTKGTGMRISAKKRLINLMQELTVEDSPEFRTSQLIKQFKGRVKLQEMSEALKRGIVEARELGDMARVDRFRKSVNDKEVDLTASLYRERFVPSSMFGEGDVNKANRAALKDLVTSPIWFRSELEIASASAKAER